jgi:hypothetical protein
MVNGNPEMKEYAAKQPSPWVSVLPLAVLTLLLYVVIRCFGGDAINGGSQIALLSATSVCVMLAIGIYRCKWAVLEEAIIDNIRASASAIIILLLIGAIAGSWMVSGVVPTMIYYGLKILHPSFFLVASCVICAGVSLMTGSSWTTIATIGVALMGTGQAMGFPEGWIAGAIISGAYFGDKLSLLSDTTVLASSTVGVPIFTHIRYMLYTTVPSFVIALAVFVIAGLTLDHTGGTHAGMYAESLRGTFRITPWLLAVPVATGVLIVRKLPAIVTLRGFRLHSHAAGAARTGGEGGRSRRAGFHVGVQGRADELLRPDGDPYRKPAAGRAGCYARHGGHAQYRMAHHLRHVLRRRDDRQRDAGGADLRFPAFRAPCLFGRGLDRRRGHLLQPLHRRPVYLDHPFGAPFPGTLCGAGARTAAVEPLGRGFGHGLLRAGAVELVRHDAGHRAGCFHIRLHALLYFQYCQSPDVADGGGHRVEDQKSRRYCGASALIWNIRWIPDL